jgi:hypothetical protein
VARSSSRPAALAIPSRASAAAATRALVATSMNSGMLSPIETKLLTRVYCTQRLGLTFPQVWPQLQALFHCWIAMITSVFALFLPLPTSRRVYGYSSIIPKRHPHAGTITITGRPVEDTQKQIRSRRAKRSTTCTCCCRTASDQRAEGESFAPCGESRDQFQVLDVEGPNGSLAAPTLAEQPKGGLGPTRLAVGTLLRLPNQAR